jgi:hypothetical protein
MAPSQRRHRRWPRWLGLGLAALAIGIGLGILVGGVQRDLGALPARFLDRGGLRTTVVAVSSCETAPDSAEPEWVPTSFGRMYDRAAMRLTRVDHELECRQAELAGLRRRGAPRWAVAPLERRVGQLEHEYSRVLSALTVAFDRQSS